MTALAELAAPNRAGRSSEIAAYAVMLILLPTFADGLDAVGALGTDEVSELLSNNDGAWPCR